MSRTSMRRLIWVAVAAVALVQTASAGAQAQRNDEEYTRLIKEYLLDPRISTELVDHLPASDRVPTTLKFPGIQRIVGTPGELTYARDIHRYMKAIADAGTGRARYMNIGKTEEGRDMIVLAIANEETIRNLETYKGYLNTLTDPRRTTEAQARSVMLRAKPIYWIVSGMHSTELGGPEMLMEMAYRLVVEDTPFIRSIRDNVITFITPVAEVDGRERIVDRHYYNRWRQEQGLAGQLGNPYWGRYVAHDNNRDGMGQMLALSKNIEKVAVEWKPTILHDLHEQANLLYASTGTGPYNEDLDPITINEWWMFAQNDVIELTKRGVPGVWTYGFYDGWTPNYMFYAVHKRNATGRFYEVQSYGPGNPIGAAAGRAAGAGRGAAPGGRAGAAGRGGDTTAAGGRGAGRGGGGRAGTVAGNSREWYRPNNNPGDVVWSARANTNIQQSGVLFALHYAGKEKDRWLENYWIKNKNAVNRGKKGPTFAWVVPAAQHSKANAAEAVNALLEQGLEFHTATSAFKAGTVDVKAGDWIIRGDQPFRTIADMYFSIQNFSLANPSPYDDTGWTFQLMRNIVITPITDSSVLKAAMAPVTAPVRALGGITGNGATVVVDHTGDNNLAAFRFRFATTRMSAAEADFEAGGRRFRAGSFIIPNANRTQLEPALRELGLSAHGVDALPTSVRTHDLDVPRIGYIHSWGNTQDEGWVRGALDFYKIPYTYFGEGDVHKRDLRAQFDVILWPHGGAVGTSQPPAGPPVPYKRTAQFTSFGAPDSTDDVRVGLGQEGLRKIYEFVQAGGTLITEGGTSAILPTWNLTPGVTVDQAQGLVAPGSVYRGLVTDRGSPIAYGIQYNQMPVYWKSAALLNAGGPPPVAAAPAGAGAAGGRGGGGRGGANWQNTSPMANRGNVLSTWTYADWAAGGAAAPATAPAGDAGRGGGRGGRGGGGRGFGGGGGGGGGTILEFMRPRIIMQFPANPSDMLLSGALSGGESLSNRPQLVDSPVGRGHVVMFSIRPFWRWQTQGTFILGFNTIMNWNDLDAGKPVITPATGSGGN